MKILVIYPTPFEAGAFFKKYASKKPALGDRFSLNAGVNQIDVVVSGYGGKAAVERIKNIAEELKPDMAMLCGFCGACAPDIAKCDYLYETDSVFLKSVFEGLGARSAKIACSAVFAGLEDKKRLYRAGYAAVDMESALFIPHFGSEKFGSFRCVSDELESNIPEEFFHLLIDTETGGDKPLLGAVFKLFMKDPRHILSLISYAKGSRKMKANYDAKALALIEKLGVAEFKG